MTTTSLPDLRRQTDIEKTRLRRAAAKVRRVHPGPLGELAARELSWWADCGHAFPGGDGLLQRLTEQIEATPEPELVRDRQDATYG